MEKEMTLKLFIGNFPPPQAGYLITYTVSLVEQREAYKCHLSSGNFLFLEITGLLYKVLQIQGLCLFIGVQGTYLLSWFCYTVNKQTIFGNRS